MTQDGNSNLAPPAFPQLRPLLTQSNLSDQERRKVRDWERELLQDIKENAADLADLQSGKFDHAANDLDVLYKSVSYPREGNLDGLCLDELDSAVGKQADLLSRMDITKFNASDLIATSAKALAAGSEFRWEFLGMPPE